MAIPFGRYQLVRKIASGGMGQVLLAKKGQDDFEKLVVIKRILPHLVEDEEFFTMFRDEAKITMRLDHPNIARINEFGEEEGIHYIEMEYVSGEDLRRVEKRAAQVDKGIPIGIILRVIADAAAGLDFAHKARDSKGVPLGLVHRDVSPQNILIGFDGSVKLIDFGVAKAMGRAQHTATGILKGKFPYMSPEQACGGELDARSDVFSLGIILWEQLTGRRLFKGDSDLATQRLVLECKVEAPSKVESSVPAGLDPVVMKALAKKPEDRYVDAAAFRMAIEEFALANAIPSSAAHLSGFMNELYAERIARETDPKFLEEDTGLTDIDAGGGRGSTGVERSKTKAARGGTNATRAAPESGSSKGIVIGLGVVALVGIAAIALWPKKTVTPVETPRPVAVETPKAEPTEVKPPPPLAVRIDSEPSGASLELGGLVVGQTPFDANIERGRLPVAVKVSAEGYESQQLMVTAETGASLSVTLKKKAAVKSPTVRNPEIKTSR